MLDVQQASDFMNAMIEARNGNASEANVACLARHFDGMLKSDDAPMALPALPVILRYGNPLQKQRVSDSVLAAFNGEDLRNNQYFSRSVGVLLADGTSPVKARAAEALAKQRYAPYLVQAVLEAVAFTNDADTEKHASAALEAIRANMASDNVRSAMIADTDVISNYESMKCPADGRARLLRVVSNYSEAHPEAVTIAKDRWDGAYNNAYKIRLYQLLEERMEPVALADFLLEKINNMGGTEAEIGKQLCDGLTKLAAQRDHQPHVAFAVIRAANDRKPVLPSVLDDIAERDPVAAARVMAMTTAGIASGRQDMARLDRGAAGIIRERLDRLMPQLPDAARDDVTRIRSSAPRSLPAGDFSIVRSVRR